MIHQLPAQVFAYGFSIRKRAIVRRFMGDVKVCFVWFGKSIPAGSTVLLWGSAEPPTTMSPSVKIIRLEDGFLRSVGLGADLVHPISWVMDSRGIYYDATHPSDLEHLLATSEFDEVILERAAYLRERIVGAGLTKYNVGGGYWQRPTGTKRVILVPGQVESDASIRFGAPGIRTNLGLLQAVREENPQAFILYKPHPDVVAGLRKQGAGEDDSVKWCDQVVVDFAMADLLKEVDEVHALTSLTGFEALLRGKKVVCYGQPFYAGWGLTEDKIPIDRRVKRLSLDSLVAATLILYPTYVSLKNATVITPEQALDELLEWRGCVNKPITLWRKLVRFFLRQRAY
ncbi:MAG: hypothetical protein PSV17_00490 [Methylotenera sp.]|uniref:capsular polysaccharide export protein, LipB/KpsS family n=1 Tax=Methylotenera sp. TaxID=2051956 RepID=UPI0024878165|nr:hypothetical protein [Methylotenera sp.]MDI1298698.1 hypothetical protein [Methylotenera sp.]MDI1307894.1 hypothetical protein [Methylotenera sp.]